MRTLLLACTWLGLSVPLGAQQTVRPTFDTITVDYRFGEPPYLHRSVATDTMSEHYQAYQLGNRLSFSGHAAEARRVMEAGMPEAELDTLRFERFSDSFYAAPAAPLLLDSAEAHEIFIINEAHHEPRHRVFTRSLLKGLYDRGYRHLGLETLGSWAGSDSIADPAAYPALTSGYYTRDPQFAAMVDEAVRLGYRIFGYEASGTGRPELRELGQMRNIMAYRSHHPEGKLLLHVGYSHALEGELGGDWIKAMAQRLADTTGLDPLTVDQTAFREMSDTAQERYEYRRFTPAEPSIFVNEEGATFSYGDGTKWFDHYVFHPRTAYLHGRPDYVFAHGQRPVYLDFSAIDLPGPWMVQAYGMEDKLAEAVPRDVIEVDNEPIALALPPGDYRLLVTAASGEQRVATVRVE